MSQRKTIISEAARRLNKREGVKIDPNLEPLPWYWDICDSYFQEHWIRLHGDPYDPRRLREVEA
jgi:hypothetical protein